MKPQTESKSVEAVRRLYEARGNPNIVKPLLAPDVHWEVVEGFPYSGVYFWKMVDRTKPSKLPVFTESELRDCEDYFLEIQSDSTLPPNEIITASERLALIGSEIDRRHSDDKHRQTQRLARWAIGVGILSAIVAIVFGIANRPTPQHVLPAATEAEQTAAVIPPTPTALPTNTPTPAALQTTAPIPAASPTMSVVSTGTPTRLQKKTRGTRRKRPTPPPGFWDRLFRPKSTR
jgi:hypothetical protein